MEPIALVAGVLLLAGTTAWALLSAPRNEDVARIRSSPPVPVREATSGSLLKVAGRVQGTRAGLVAPLSGRPCAAYHVELSWELDLPHDGSPMRGSLLRAKSASVLESGGDAIHVVDASGRAWVPLRQVDWSLDHQDLCASGKVDQPTAAMRALLKRHGHSAGTPFGGFRSVRYRELILPEERFVAVVGRAVWEFDPDAKTAGEGYRDRPRRLRIGAPGRGRVLITDDVG